MINDQNRCLEVASSTLSAWLRKTEELDIDLNAQKLIKDFVSCFDDLPPYSGYRYTPPTAIHMLAAIRQKVGHQLSQGFLSACTLQGIMQSLTSPRFENLPRRVQQHQLKQFDRIVKNTEDFTRSCDLENDLFQKDFGLALLRLYAAAAQLVDYRAGTGRAIVTKGGVRDIPRRLLFFAEVGGFKPFFEIHTHLSYLDEFDEAGWNECYRCCSDLYSIHPEVLGMYGGSWFYDPALEEISPRLNYLRAIPQLGGAKLLFTSINEQVTKDATSTSPTRKKLYENGLYIPKSYALIWPKAKQIHWSSEFSASKSI
jgi:hypothetical protein